VAELPTGEELRSRIRALDPVEKKVLGGLIVLMIRNHHRVKDSEWIYESLVHLSVPALGLEQEGVVDEDVGRVQEFVQASARQLLGIAGPLFAVVAEDMREKMAQGEDYGLGDACARALDYFE